MRVGFDPQMYPGNGPYFAVTRECAESYQAAYRNGLQEIILPSEGFEDLVRRGIVCVDPLLPDTAWHVPADGLPEFNRLMRIAGRCVYHPEL